MCPLTCQGARLPVSKLPLTRRFSAVRRRPAPRVVNSAARTPHLRTDLFLRITCCTLHDTSSVTQGFELTDEEGILSHRLINFRILGHGTECIYENETMDGGSTCGGVDIKACIDDVMSISINLLSN